MGIFGVKKTCKKISAAILTLAIFMGCISGMSASAAQDPGPGYEELKGVWISFQDAQSAGEVANLLKVLAE